MTFSIAFARAHWRALCVALGLALAFGAGRWSKRPPPATAVALREDTAVREASAAKVDQHKAEGPVRDDWTFYGPVIGNPEVAEGLPKLPAGSVLPVRPGGQRGAGAPSSPCQAYATLHEERGPVVTDTHATSSENFVEKSRLDLKLTPPPSGPRFSFGLGLEDPLGAQRPHFEVGVRVLTVPLLDVPLWLRLGSTPSRGIIHGSTITGEIQW